MFFPSLVYQVIISFLEERDIRQMQCVNRQWKRNTLIAISAIFQSDMHAINSYYPGCTVSIDLKGKSLQQIFATRTTFTNAVIDEHLLRLSEDDWNAACIEFACNERPPEVKRIHQIAWAERRILENKDHSLYFDCRRLTPLFELGARDRAHNLFISTFNPSIWGSNPYSKLFEYDLMKDNLSGAEEILTKHLLSSRENKSTKEKYMIDFACKLVRQNSLEKAAHYAERVRSKKRGDYYFELFNRFQGTNRFSEALEVLAMMPSDYSVMHDVKQLIKGFVGGRKIGEFVVQAIAILADRMPNNIYARYIHPLHNEEATHEEKVRTFTEAIEFCPSIRREMLEHYYFIMLISNALVREAESGRNLDWVFEILHNERAENTIGEYLNHKIIPLISDPHPKTIILRLIIQKYHELGDTKKTSQYTEWLMSVNQPYTFC